MSDEDMDRLLGEVERSLGVSWVGAVEWLREQNELDDVAERVAAGDLTGAIKGVEAAAKRVAAAIHDGYVTGGEAAAAWLDEVLPAELVTFDVANVRAAQWAARNTYETVAELIQEQRLVLQQVVHRGITQALNPRVIARDLRQSIGLTVKQEAHVDSYRTALENGDYENALARELRSGRYDRTLAAAARDARALTPEQIDNMVEAYRRNWVKYRGEVIARTDGLRVLHQGQDEMFQQAIQSGVVAHSQLVGQWNSAHDERTRFSHRAMDGQQRLMGEAFISGDGYQLMFPGDPNAPLEEILQCRCNRSMRLMPVGYQLQRAA